MSQEKEREDSDELLSCPFCGHDEATMTVNEFRDHYITCDNCEADGPWQHTKEAAIEAWNTRAALASQQAGKGEPVAYIHRQGRHWEVSERFLNDDEKARGWTEEPLYASPSSREPLTEEQIAELYVEWSNTDRASFADLMRSVERAHGIHSRGEGES